GCNCASGPAAPDTWLGLAALLASALARRRATAA
ncbi:MAG: MYXO-CTERM sorting domain-containing protein, partial [Deltaproteobacteria bacterium]|nr:MYXO-CTERM sorting domain-containing protein [Deltaproteobacteria bacterium]